MVEQPRLQAPRNPTLSEFWQDAVTGLPRRSAASTAAISSFAIVASRWLDLPRITTLAAAVGLAFGCDALLWSGERRDPRLQTRAGRAASTVVRVVAAVAGAAIALILLGVLFGDKIEVMRR